MSTASSRNLQCVVVTPERTVLDTAADSIVVPMYDGELGVFPGRAPLIGRLGPGELRARRGNTIERFFVDGGFAQIRDNVVTVLTPRAQKASEINEQAANQALQSLPTTEAQQKAQLRARVQLRVARRAAAEA
jgi:F-type H+-transporting ATPase subunit epsilon